MSTYYDTDTDTFRRYWTVRCPECGKAAVYHEPLDCAFHLNGSDNTECWRRRRRRDPAWSDPLHSFEDYYRNITPEELDKIECK